MLTCNAIGGWNRKLRIVLEKPCQLLALVAVTTGYFKTLFRYIRALKFKGFAETRTGFEMCFGGIFVIFGWTQMGFLSEAPQARLFGELLRSECR